MYYALIISFLMFYMMSFINIRPAYYAVLVTVILAGLAYLFDPIYGYKQLGIYTDAYRLFNDMNDMRALGDSYEGYMGAPLSGIYLNVIASLGDNNLLPMITAFINYGFGFLIIYKIGKDIGCSSYIIIKGMFLFLIITNYSSVIGNVRYPLALMVFFWIAYYELVKKRAVFKCGYFILPLLHPGSVCFILLRFLSSYKIKYGLCIFPIIAAGFWLYYEDMILWLISIGSLLHVNTYFFTDIQYKIETYSDVSNYVPATMANTVYMISCLAVLFIWIYFAKKDNELGCYKKFINIALWGAVVSLCFVTNYQLMGRFLTVINFYIPFFFLITHCNDAREKNKHSGIISVLYNVMLFINIIYYFGQTYGYHTLVFFGE